MYERYQIDWEAYHQRAQTGPCFICQIIARDPSFPADIIYEDASFIVFLDKYPRVIGHTLVAPRKHREQVTGDLTLAEYLDLQRMVYRAAEAVRQEMGAERVYLLSLGSNQGNAHIHWHIVPLPPGVPYGEQQLGVYRQGILRISEKDRVSLVARIRERIERTT
ncbi:MAG: HIT domain-containing protein [Chloroflexi bacterium]|nr:HIT domain-containing protein [Chloroflexota bacterium]MBU1746745.1 HIT domain-containing protein [Chloroflexota bacterium]